MSTPPRRRRPELRPPSTGGWLPTAAIGLGVIIAGLGIGALVAVLMQRSGTPPVGSTPLAVVTGSPQAVRPVEPPPLAIATITAPRTARPTPQSTPQPSAEPTEQASPSSAPSPTAAPTVAPRVTPTRAAAVAVVRTAAPARVALVTSAPTVSQTPSPTAQPTRTPAPAVAPVAADAAIAPASTPAADSPYDEHASAVVRRYLDALIRGDEKAAYSALGGGGGSLSEQAFLDPSARIVSLKVTRIDASNASVGCEIAAAKGRYYATYHVTAATSGPYIAQHDYIKV